MALFSFIEGEHMNITSACTDIQLLEKTPLVQSFCAHTIQQDDLLEISDTTKDHRFKNLDFVKDTPFLRYYAGVPIKLNNENIGSLCVLDRKPGKLTETQRSRLLSIQHIVCETLLTQNINTQQIQPLYRANRYNISNLNSSTLVHELSQPVTAINQYLDSLSSFAQEALIRKDAIEEHLQRIRKQLNRVNQILLNHKKLLNYNSNDNLEHFSKIDINELINDTFKLIDMELLDKRITLTKHLAIDSLHVFCDQVQVQQVLLNLTLNSIRDLSKKDLDRRITLRSSVEDENYLAITVEDNGSGLDPDLFNSLTRFHVLENTEGMGLGLILCKHIMGNHMGNLLHIPTETGTCIKLLLPINRVD